MTIKSSSVKQKFGLDTPLLSTFTLNWEIALYAAILVLAIVTRFYDLGVRVMSHDESLHTLYSWNLYAGKGYQHDPLMHGPFLFHITAFMYFLFGDNDFTARIATALLGTLLVILPYWFRPWLGRLGGLAASFMILISPGLIYYSRYIRHDIFISVWTVLMVLAFFQFMRTQGVRWLYVGAVAVALMLSTKEISYIHGFIGVTFIAVTFMWESLPGSRRKMLNLGLLGLFAVLIVLIVISSSVQSGQLPPVIEEGEAAVAGFNPWGHVDLLLMLAGLLLGVLVIQMGTDATNRPVMQFLKSLPAHKMDIGKAALAGIIIFILLHTTFFSNVGGLYTGTIGEVSYWLEQHDVQRGGQPWYYYLFLVPMYEFLPVTVGVTGAIVYGIRNILGKKFPTHVHPEAVHPDTSLPASGSTAVYRPSDGGTFAAFTIYWTLVSFVIYSWAGEKMPWLTIHMTLPVIFLAAHVIQTVLGKFNWTEARQKGGLLMGGALLLIPAALVSIISADPFRSQSLQSINQTTRFIAGIVIFLVLAGVVVYYAIKMGRGLAARSAFVTALLLMTLLTVRFAWLLNYVNYDYVNEVLVYAHASPDVKLALNQIDEISRRTVGDKMIRVAYDNDSTWPLEWYMREYPNRVYYGENPTRDALDSPIVIVGSANESKAKPYLGDEYTSFNYRLVWWPVEDYKDQSISRLVETYITGPSPENPDLPETEEQRAARKQTVRDNWQKLWNILFYRDYQDYNLNEWPFVHRFNVYIRNDVLNDVWDYQSGPVQLAVANSAAGLDPYTGKRAETDAVAVWGNNGTTNGQFAAPRNMAVGPDGSIYVADSGNHRIQVFDQSGNYLFTWGSEGAAPGQLNEPWGIAVSNDGTVYVADTWNHRVQAFSPTGELINTFGTFADVQHDAQAEPGAFWGPRDIAIDAEGNLYVTDTGNKRVQKFTADGRFIQTWGGGGIVPGTFEEPVGIDIDSDGNIYVADTWNRRVQKFDANFTPVLEWKVAGWEGEGIANKPYIAADDQGRVFISDPEGYRVIGYNGSNGDVLVTWGQFGQDLASFGLPSGIKIDDQGMLLVVDSDNNRIMKFQVPEPNPADTVE